MAARHEAIYRVKFEKPALSSGQLGLWFNRDHSSVLFALVRFQELTGAPVMSVRRQQTSQDQEEGSMMTNDKRADEVEAALLVFAERTGLDPDPVEGDGPVTVAGDMIASILHWVSGKLGREAALDAVRSGIGHFVSESNIDYSQPEDEVDQLGPDAWVTIKVSCNDEVWHARTGLGSEIVKEQAQ